MTHRPSRTAAGERKKLAPPRILSASPAAEPWNSGATQSRRDCGRPIRFADFQAKFETPFALVGVRTEGEMLAEVVYLPRSAGALAPTNALAERACAQIECYLADPGYRFELPLKYVGTAFQRRVWDRIAAIPRGQTMTYGDMARSLQSGPRAVGQACGTNHFPLVIPCHRVVAAKGLGGFAHNTSGYLIEVKRWLLRHEGRAH